MAIESLKSASKTGADGTQLVTFLLKDEEFGFDIMSVQEIIRLPKMSKLPHTPDYVEGVFNLRGAVLPIFDIRARFGMKREERTDRSRVLVIDVDGKQTGLLVDGVRQVTRVGRHELEPPPVTIRSATADYIDGVVKLNNGSRIIISLDARRVCSLDGSGANGKVAQTLVPHSIEKIVAAPPAGSDGSGTEGQSKEGKVHQLVSFQVGQEEFAFPMEHVREILRLQTPKEVPGAPEHLLGVLTVRGNILPIVDLRRLLRHTSFAADLIVACRQASGEYKTWLEQSETSLDKADYQGAAKASERLRNWLLAFNSSSQTLMETVAQVRGLNEEVSKEANATIKHERDLAGLKALHVSLVSRARAIVAALLSFEEQVEKNIGEDQRIIVVDSNGFQLGLVVDHVNEVLGVQDDAIEPPPDIAHHGGSILSGIARLDQGNRLILLLDTGNLLDRQKLVEINGTNQDATLAEQHVEAVQKQEDGGTNAEELQLVTFLLGKEEYGIPIAKIQEIDRLANITKTPKAPKFVEGVTNLRGEVIPVLSTRALFALEDRISDDRTRVIIVDLGGTKTGLVVDSVKEVLSILSTDIAAPPASISGAADEQFISGIAKVDNGKRMIVLLDVGRVLTRGERGELQAISRTA
jgi:purine-binding chemotaxis protein CheW